MPQTPQRLILQGWFTLLVPPDWVWDEEEGITCIYKPEAGIGSINISLYDCPGAGLASDDELLEQALNFARNLGAKPDPAEASMREVGQGPASYLECLDNAGDRWRVWHIARPGQLALLTYNCAAAEAARERDLIDKMLKSFAWQITGDASDSGAGHASHGG